MKEMNKCTKKTGYVEKYKDLLVDYFNNKNVFLFWKGRVALYAILKAMRLSPGDEVILPGFTCVVVPNAILYLGLKPVYVDIDRNTLLMDIAEIEKKVTSRTKAIICQNVFGLSDGICEVVCLAKKYQLFTIEDCAHGFGGANNGLLNGSQCDAAFFSTQWSKPYSTGIGGIALINNGNILSNFENDYLSIIRPTCFESLQIYLLIKVKKIFLSTCTYWLAIKTYRWLSHHNIVIGSSSKEEVLSDRMPKDYYKGISFSQAIEGLKRLPRIAQIIEIRKNNAKKYNELLKRHYKTTIPDRLFKNHSFLRYPAFVKNKKMIMRMAEKKRISIGDWFVSPLHPIETNLDRWGYKVGDCPNAEWVAKRIINFPTNVRWIDRVLEFINNNVDEII